MKKNSIQIIWMIILSLILLGLSIWGVWFIENIDNKISIFGIIAVIVAAFTSVLTVSINNNKAKEREYELHILKEKQKVYEHFYNSFFNILNETKKGKSGVTNKSTKELLLFKQGLMNWGSERLITKYIEYDNKLGQKKSIIKMMEDGNDFLKEIRKDMGFEDSKKLNLMKIILTPEARNELEK